MSAAQYVGEVEDPLAPAEGIVPVGAALLDRACGPGDLGTVLANALGVVLKRSERYAW